MKKLIVTMAIAMTAVVASASQVKWSTTAIYKSGSDSVLMTGSTVYLINVADFTQQTILDAMVDGKTLSEVIGSKYVLTATTGEDGKVAATYGASGTYADNSSQTFFSVLANGDDSEVFFTANSTKTILGTGDTTVSGVMTKSKSAAFDGTSTTFATGGAGWYAVPEPTSGLLMLLGMAGLALRRRRA